MSDDQGRHIAADAQFGIVHILRPFSGFEAVYTGQSAIRPIMFTEGGQATDPLAGTTGYSARLIKGLSVPLGARVVLWLPLLVGIIAAPLAIWNYKWAVTWRLRNTFDFRQSRIPFHLGKQGVGVPDTTVPLANQARVVIPACVQSTLYSQPRPEIFSSTNNFGPTAINQAELIMVDATNVGAAPLLPSGVNGFFEQGLSDPATTAQNQSYIPYEIQAEGDELLIGVTRDVTADFQTTTAAANWNFAVDQVDHQLSVNFGNGSGTTLPDIGVYVMSGSAP